MAAVSLSLMLTPIAASAAHRHVSERGALKSLTTAERTASSGTGSSEEDRWTEPGWLRPTDLAAPLALRRTLGTRVAMGPSDQALVSTRSETCPDARRGLTWYRAHARSWAHKLSRDASAGAGGRRIGETSSTRPTAARNGSPSACSVIRRAAKWWRAKAHANRLKYERWAHDYAWWLWLPSKFRRVGHCETGSTPGGTAAGNWRWDSGRYVSAFGIYRPAYEAYHRWTGRNTPREQYEVASSIQARFGWGAWGCGGA